MGPSTLVFDPLPERRVTDQDGAVMKEEVELALALGFVLVD